MLPVVDPDEGGAGAEEGDGEGDAEGAEEPAGVDEFELLGCGGAMGASLRMIGWAGHGADCFSISWPGEGVMVADWVRLCAVNEAPKVGEVMEAEAAGVAVCVANVEGKLCALDNWCPHRRGPLGQGWLEGAGVVCPWHSWVFSTETGMAEPPERAHVNVFPVKVEGDDVLVDLS